MLLQLSVRKDDAATLHKRCRHLANVTAML